MKKLPILFIALLFMYACDFSGSSEKTNDSDTETTANEVSETPVVENTERSATTNPLYNDLMEPSSGGVFRGVNFNMKRAKVLDLEESRMTVSIYKDEIPEELVITTDMGKEVLDFADVTYSFDEQGLYAIKVETYNVTLEKATEVFDMIIDHYTEQFGEPNIAEDGYSEFTATDEKSGLDYMIAVKNIDDVEESFGLYIFFDLI